MIYYTIYKTTNKITNEIYIGQHITEDTEDNYLGSGAGILESIEKYGSNNFTKEILFVFDNFDDMNNKEKELVDFRFISRHDVLNRQQGGRGWGTVNTLVAGDKHTTVPNWRRILKSDYNKDIHKTPSTGNRTMYDSTLARFVRVDCEEVSNNTDRYKSASHGRVSVYDLEGNSSAIDVKEYNPTIHKKVFGGIVAEVNGNLTYVDKSYFDKHNLKGCHHGKVTAIVKASGKRKHIDVDEFHRNRDLYVGPGEGMVTVYDLLTKQTASVTKTDWKNDKNRYVATTSGMKTVFDIKEKSFKNIPKGEFDRSHHRLASDKMIKCFLSDGSLLFEFWGSKIDFVKQYGVLLYEAAIRQEKCFSTFQRNKFRKYLGCSFLIIDWRNNHG